MAIPTTNAAQELPAVNQILASVGQAPVTTLDQTNPDVAIAYDTLLQVSREVQSEGWTFNREDHYVFTPDANNEIVIPNNVLQLDLTKGTYGSNKRSIRRNGKLYDKHNHTYEWKDGDVECDVVWLFDWVDLPSVFQDYIIARAATLVSSRIIGDGNQYQMLQQNEAFLRSAIMEYECNQGDHTFFGSPNNDPNNYLSYQPYLALRR